MGEARERILARARSAADRYVALHPPRRLGWGWEAGVFLHALCELRRADPIASARYGGYVRDYHARWARRGAPPIDQSDRCAPALSALALAQGDGDGVGLAAASAVARYLKGAPREACGALNHTGHSWLSALYPRSIWVDSLMMYGVFAARWGAWAGDPALVDFAARQVGAFAAKLQDARTGLFRHAWLTRLGRAVPAAEAYWLRGNGWVLAAGAQIAAALPAGHPEAPAIVAALRRLAGGLVRYQRPDGQWETILNEPGRSYPEASGTALVACGLGRGVADGWLEPALLAPAARAYEGLRARLVETPSGLCLLGVSGPTNALPKFTYRLVPTRRDLGYGVGAYLLASVALADAGAAAAPGSGAPGPRSP
ncbi:MAG TPA: glycoside hydrolase family 88 protein [Polyangiaceae bacterium]|nr:glycoside hydrolase family 88 protein [Polyangiaceae bacterium]